MDYIDSVENFIVQISRLSFIFMYILLQVT